jgi:ArsR family transcriptional regulator, arsenate/arsenite/antimonite-responsive transcriptional repressor
MTNLQREIESLGKGIGNGSRYKIIQVLLKGEQTVGGIVKAVKLSQPAVSQHLKTLKTCNLVLDKKKGQEVYYSVNTKYTVELLKSLLDDVSNCPSNRK